MKIEMVLTDKQIKEFRRVWFIYGNSGKKSTLFNHKLIQGFIECGEDRRAVYREGNENMKEKYSPEEYDKMAVTEECFKVVDDIINNP